MSRKLLTCALIVLLTGCSSVKKYNEQISKLHSPEEMHDDIDYVYHKLQKLHPDLYWYISKDSLDEKVKMLKTSIQKPISSKEFYKQLSPVVASIRQGHTAIYSPHKKQTKKERKEKGKRSSPFRPLTFQEVEGKLFIKKNYGKDSTLVVGSELLSVDNEKNK